MGYSLPDFQLTNEEWTDLGAVDGYEDIVNTRITVQAKGGQTALVFIGGAVAPDGNDGMVLAPGSAVSQTSDHWWVKGTGKLAILVEE